jgi:hypothetical protein
MQLLSHDLAASDSGVFECMAGCPCQKDPAMHLWAHDLAAKMTVNAWLATPVNRIQ